MRTKKQYGYIFALCFLLLLPSVARADNCGGLVDCFNTLRAALASLLGIGVFAILLSLILDLSPVGRLKGILEAILGNDIITGEPLELWQRLLGLVPGGKSTKYILNPGWKKNWEKYMLKRGWSHASIEETLSKGVWKPYTGNLNYLNPNNPMSIVTNPKTGLSLIVDNVTKEIIELGGEGFLF